MLSRVGLVLVLWLTFAGVAHAVVIPVTRTDDRVGGTCAVDGCTLREAIAAAAPGDTVLLGGTSGAPQVYTLTQGAQLTVDQAITIAGGGSSVTAIDGGANFDSRMRPNRIMRVNVAVTIRDLAFSNGRDGNDEIPCSACPTLSLNGGGAIFTTNALTLTRVVFEDNQNSPVGGAVSNSGTLTLNDVEFHGNSAAYGGALFSRGGTVNADGVTVHGNAGSARGAVYVNGGSMSLRNTTVAGNGQSNTIGGGVVNNGGDLTLASVTIADNVRGGLLRESGSTRAANSILASGCVPAGQFGALAAVSEDLGHNLDEDDSCALTAATKVIGPARWAPVNANGGATPTMALLSGSAALDRIPVQDCPAADQRGAARFGACDIGAFEAERRGQPSATTETADDIGDTQAVLTGTVALAGEAGKLSFEWGVEPALTSFTTTPGVGVFAGATRTEPVYGLPPGTRIYYRAVAENATGIARGAIKSFTTQSQSAPPTISDLHAIDVSDESVTLRFTVDPGGADAGYRIKVNGDDPPLAPLPGTGPREITRTLANLAPNTDYRFQVEVTNAGHTTGIDDGLIDRRTLRRFEGTPGTPLTVSQDCPGPGRIVWGDGASSPLVCASGTFTATHTYAAAGRHRVQLRFEEGTTDALVTLVAPATGQLLSVTVAGKGRVTGNGLDCPGVCSVELPTNTSVRLTATPGSGAQFQGWSAFCGTSPTCEFELGDDQSVAADFSGTVEAPGLGELHVSEITATSARVGFLVDPNGVRTTYRLVVNGTELAPATVGSGSGPVAMSHALAGLEPSRRYDVRVIASNSAGDVSDATAFTTAESPVIRDPTPTATATPLATAVPTATPTVMPPPSPGPTAAVDVVAAPTSGTILVKLPRTNRFVALKAGQELPYGTEVDARKGRVKLTSIPKAGAPPETAEFYAGRFRLSYVGGITNLTLSEPLAPCKKAKGKRASAAAKKAKSRKLWGKGKGSFRTTGKYSAATVRGTTWLVQDTCAGTLTRVTQGAVTVRHGKKTVVVRAGKKYLAKARR